jgi:hypothetical protein
MFWTFLFLGCFIEWDHHRLIFYGLGLQRVVNSEVMFDHAKIVPHISQDNALTGFVNVQAKQAFS